MVYQGSHLAVNEGSLALKDVDSLGCHFTVHQQGHADLRKNQRNAHDECERPSSLTRGQRPAYQTSHTSAMVFSTAL
jgi:hypothetical protein